MSDEDDEFEDAVDNITVAARRTANETVMVDTTSPVFRHPASIPIAAPRSMPPPSRIPVLPQPAPRSITPQLIGIPPSQVTPQESISSATRRDRLSALRARMRDEFGARDVTPLTGTSQDGDNASVVSDATSLHSWHRRILAGSHAGTVHPSDSVSTRAASSCGTHMNLWSPEASPLTRIDSVPDVDVSPPSGIQQQQNIGTPLRPAMLPPYLAGQTPSTSNSLTSPLSPTSSIAGPPPLHPPPPLPPRDRTNSAPVAEHRVPPPLPPRNPSIRLPDPVAKELVARLASMDADDDIMSAPNLKSSESVTTTPRSQQLSTNSNDSLVSSGECNGSGKRPRGHAKTNSLDRGLTLAKTLKAGPFPPPSNKSNSLTREECDSGEETERNTAAEGVIRQITCDLGAIPEQLHRLHVDSSTNGLDPIPSGSSSISSPGSVAVSKAKAKNKKGRRSKESTPDVSNGKKAATLPKMSSPIEDIEMKSPYEDEGEARLGSVSVTSSIDPITRDVERRMSMKRDGTLVGDSEELPLDRMSLARSSLSNAKSMARNYSNLATDLFKGAFQKVRGASHAGPSASKQEDDTSDSEGEQSETGVPPQGPAGGIVRPRKAKKGPFDFENLRVVQDLGTEHRGAVWCIRFSVCGRMMATAGQDSIVRVWVARNHVKYFANMRDRFHEKKDVSGSASDVYESTMHDMEVFRPPSSIESNPNSESFSDEDDQTLLFAAKPFVLFKGHTADVLDLSWSKNYFLLSSGMDRTVKLWHLSRTECLCCFQHVDFVTCVSFLPKDDRYFLSGSMDGKLRLWHIPEKKVAVWNEVQVKFITAIAFVKSGKFVVVGTYNGRCYFYTTDQLKYHTVIDVRSTRGKNSRGHKVTGLSVHGDKLLVTSNDSRIRMYDVRDKALTCKFRGAQNDRSQIRASFSPDGRHIICGSEDKFVYLWRSCDLPSSLSVRKDRNAMWERVRTHTVPVSVAVFAPKPLVFMSMLERKDPDPQLERGVGHVIVSADLNGMVKVMVNRVKIMKAGNSSFFNPPE